MSKKLFQDASQLIAEYQAGTAAAQLAAKYNTSTTVITRTLKNHGVDLRSLSEANTGKTTSWKGKKHSSAARAKMSANHADVSGENNPNFQGKGEYAPDGVWLNETNRGYLRRRAPEHPLAMSDGWIGEHVYQACIAYGIDSVRGKEVHHIDRCKTNNKPENLIALDAGEHAIVENIMRWRNKALTRNEIIHLLATLKAA